MSTTTVCYVVVRRPVMCTAECNSAESVAQCLAPVLGLIGEFLCKMCKSTDKIPACAVGECDNCYHVFCTFCGRGCQCSWRYLTSARIAALTIERFFLRNMLLGARCQYDERAYGGYDSECGEPVSRRLIQEYNMKSIVCCIGPNYYKCREHICQCQKDVNAPTKQCGVCYQLYCISCFDGCRCAS